MSANPFLGTHGYLPMDFPDRWRTRRIDGMPRVIAGMKWAFATIHGPAPEFGPIPLAAEPDGDGSQK